ncbi:MAG TPA: GtrA family protein [Mycobacteriales bacterium]|nr:GtrA family protein [Mycobacteriales bacterium]
MNRLQQIWHEIAKFGLVGAVNYVLDVSLFNALIVGPLHDRPLTSKAISTVVAATSSYFMNRHWTWRNRARTGLGREYGLFIVLSAVGLAITLGCLGFGEYVLNQHSWLARNVWGNVVGVGLGMVWRFWSFKRWVFLPAGPAADADDDAAHAALV